MPDIVHTIETEAHRLVNRLYERRVVDNVDTAEIDILIAAAQEVSELHLAFLEAGITQVWWAPEWSS